MGAHQAAGGRHLCLAEGGGGGRGEVEAHHGALALLTDGVDLRGAKLRPWYERE